MPLSDDCIGAKDMCGFLEIESQEVYYDECKQEIIVFVNVPVEELGKYLFIVKNKIDKLQRGYGQFVNFFLKPIFVFKKEWLAKKFIAFYEKQNDKEQFIIDMQAKYNQNQDYIEIDEKQFSEFDKDNQQFDLFNK